MGDLHGAKVARLNISSLSRSNQTRGQVTTRTPRVTTQQIKQGDRVSQHLAETPLKGDTLNDEEGNPTFIFGVTPMYGHTVR
jgi:hypothetical protein